jgi:hypothetical protein
VGNHGEGVGFQLQRAGSIDCEIRSMKSGISLAAP